MGVNDIYRFWHGQQVSEFASSKVGTADIGASSNDTNTDNNEESYKKRLGKAAEKQGGHNRIFHTMGAIDSLDGTAKAKIILSGM